jgi:hypothetical protein
MSIRKRLLIIAFLGTTALTSTPAQAGPVVPFIAGFASFVSTGVAVGAGIGGAFALGSATAAFFGTALGQIVLSIGFSLISAALTPKPQSVDPGDRLVNYAQPITYFERVYGKVRNGGALGCTSFRSDRRHYTAILASHSIKGVLEHYLDDTFVEVDEDNLIATAPMTGHGSIRTYTGQPGQLADPTLVADIPEWTEAHDMAGLSYAALYAKRVSGDAFTDVYTRGDIWGYAPVIEGNDRIYDPRNDSYGYSNNAALVIAHEVVHTLGGAVDWEAVAVEADHSDTLVTNADGGTQRKWTINTLFADDQDWEEVRATMLAACDGFMFERADGKVGFYVGRWQEPGVTLTDADFLSLNVAEGAEISTATQFVGQYVEPANLYRRTPTGAVIADPLGRRITRDVPLIAIDNYDQAVRVVARTAAVDRAQYQVAGTLKLSGRALTAQRFARIEHAELGLSVAIEIGELTRRDDGTYDFRGVSTTQADHEFDAATQTPTRPIYEDLAADNAVAAVTGLSGAVAGSVGSAATILFSWSEQDESLTQQIHIRSIDAGQPDWQVYGAGEGQSSFSATGLTDGATYEAQVRNRTSAGRVSEWSPISPVSVTAVADSVPPSALTAFSATVVGSDVELALTSPNDAGYFATRILRADYPGGFGGSLNIADASVMRIEYGLPGNPDTWTDTSVPVGVHAYWAEPINGSGIAGPRSGPEAIEIT